MTGNTGTQSWRFTTLQSHAVLQAVLEGESEDEHCELQAEGGAMEKAETSPEAVPLSTGGVLPRTSKESTPGASSSKEGTQSYCGSQYVHY